MNVAFISEDRSDMTALSVVIQRITARAIQPISYSNYVGFDSVLKEAPHRARRAAEAGVDLIVVAVDCDGTDDHFSTPPPHQACRWCRLAATLPARHEVEQLSQGRSTLLPTLLVRTMESWLAVAGNLSIPGSIHDFGRTPPERRRLKKLVYGDETPPRAVMEATSRRLFDQCDLVRMEQTLPSFAHFAKSVRDMKSAS